ncbi:MAG: NAD-dependent epimerase/dehydratase family protein [Balneolaceae bacterium]|jgi:nucleoside-diphosphate-sugar epimerase
MKIFITGATGYIGFSVAKAMRRAGHNVFGLTRSEEKAVMLAKEEIHPVIGDMQNSESYREKAEQCSVLIHAAADYQNNTVELDKKTVQTLIGAGASGNGPQPKTFIYTSGCWVHGNTGYEAVDERTPLNPIEAVTWRPEVENMVLDAEDIDGIVVRPGCVYGERGGLMDMWFKAAEESNQIDVVGDGTNFWSLIHADDLADAYVRIAETAPAGEIFNISDRSRCTVKDMVQAIARATDFEGSINFVPVEEAAEEMGPMAEALAVDQHIDSRKAVSLLDWQPKHGGFVDEVETCYIAWKAHNN